MRTDELDYDLPAELIATRPAEPRDSARMLVHLREANRTEHRRVSDLPAYLDARDVLVFNDSAVIPARLRAVHDDTGGRVEGIYLQSERNQEWRLMLRSNRRLRPAMILRLLDRAGRPTENTLQLTKKEGSHWCAQPRSERPATAILEEVGLTPLPPYVLRARGDEVFDDDADRSWYQTVYADFTKRESVAAPTAGLHFTNNLLAALDRKGIRRHNLALHVGPGTFQPVSTDRLESHRMHEERFEIGRETLRSMAEARRQGGRAIAVGTTTVRALESIDPDEIDAGESAGSMTGTTDLFIYPPHRFRWIDGVLTNFHLPRSTLLALVAALTGVDRLKSLYQEAIDRNYRFYSYGDAMLLLP